MYKEFSLIGLLRAFAVAPVRVCLVLARRLKAEGNCFVLLSQRWLPEIHLYIFEAILFDAELLMDELP